MKLLPTFLFLFFSFLAFAQTEYSYTTDRKFSGPEKFLGYSFVPSLKINPKQDIEQDLDPGAISFGIDRNYLYIKGEEESGAYNLTQIRPTEYGYKLELMNARDAQIQGHLKIIMMPGNFVEALIFRKSQKHDEIVYYLPEIEKNLENKEKEYFTDRADLFIENEEGLWGKTIRPFLLIEKVQTRFRMQDSMKVSFIEVIEVIDKTKQPKAKETDTIPVKPYIPVTVEALDTLDLEVLKKNKNIKIIRTYSIHLSFIQTLEDGSIKTMSNVYPINKVKEKMDSSAGPKGDKYQIEFGVGKLPGGLVHLYLDGERRVTSIDFGPDRYLVRGY